MSPSLSRKGRPHESDGGDRKGESSEKSDRSIESGSRVSVALRVVRIRPPTLISKISAGEAGDADIADRGAIVSAFDSGQSGSATEVNS